MNPGAQPAMPTFASLDALNKHRALGIAVSTIESFPEGELRSVAAQFLRDDVSWSRAELAKNLTQYALELYSSGSPMLVEFEKRVDEISRERFRER
jgi:hypothetical protein